MSQASDLGTIGNLRGGLVRARINANIQALVTNHYGPSEPPLIYPCMFWFDSGSGSVKWRDPTNSSWIVVGTIGPPLMWSSVVAPQTGFSTGDLKPTLRTSPDSGWVMMNDGTIGSASSGASTRANADAEALFTLLWNGISDTWCTLYGAGGSTPSGRGASAAADWAAHRHIALPKVLGRALCVAGWGSGLSNLALGTAQGAEAIALALGNLPAHGHSLPSHTHGAGSLTADGGGAHAHVTPSGLDPVNPYGDRQIPLVAEGGRPLKNVAESGGVHSHTVSGATAGGGAGSTGSAGSGAAHANIQPSAYLNVMVKL